MPTPIERWTKKQLLARIDTLELDYARANDAYGVSQDRASELYREVCESRKRIVELEKQARTNDYERERWINAYHRAQGRYEGVALANGDINPDNLSNPEPVPF